MSKYTRDVKKDKNKIKNMPLRISSIMAAFAIAFSSLSVKETIEGKKNVGVSNSDQKIIDELSFNDEDTKYEIKQRANDSLSKILKKKSFSKEQKDFIMEALEKYIDNTYDHPDIYEYDLETGRLSNVKILEKNIQNYLTSVSIINKIILVDSKNQDSHYNKKEYKKYIEDLKSNNAAGLAYSFYNIIVIDVSAKDRLIEILNHETEHIGTQNAVFPKSVDNIFEDEEIRTLYQEVYDEFIKVFSEGIATREGNKVYAYKILDGDVIENTFNDDTYAKFKTESVYGLYYTMLKNYEYLLGEKFVDEWMQNTKYDKNVIQEMKNIIDQKYGEGTFEELFKDTLKILKSKMIYDNYLEQLKEKLTEEDYISLLNAYTEGNKDECMRLFKKYYIINYESVMANLDFVENSDEVAMDFQIKMLQLMQVDISQMDAFSDKDIIEFVKVYKTYNRTMIDFENINNEISKSKFDREKENIEAALLNVLRTRKIKLGDYQFGKDEKNDKIIFNIYYNSNNIDIYNTSTIQIKEVESSGLSFLRKKVNEMTEELSAEEIKYYNEKLNEDEKQFNPKKIMFINFLDSDGKIIEPNIMVDDEKYESVYLNARNCSIDDSVAISEYLKFIDEQNFNLNDKNDVLKILCLLTQLNNGEGYKNLGNLHFYIERDVNCRDFVLESSTLEIIAGQYIYEIQENIKNGSLKLKYSDFDPNYPPIEIYSGHINDIIGMWFSGNLTNYCENLDNNFHRQLRECNSQIEYYNKNINNTLIMPEDEWIPYIKNEIEFNKQHQKEMERRKNAGEISEEEYLEHVYGIEKFLIMYDGFFDNPHEYYSKYADEQKESINNYKDILQKSNEEKQYLEDYFERKEQAKSIKDRIVEIVDDIGIGLGVDDLILKLLEYI